MAKNASEPAETSEVDDKPAEEMGPGGKRVQVAGIIAMLIYVVLLALLLLYAIIQFWPSTVTGEEAIRTAEVTILWQDLEVSSEVRLILLVLLAGSLGGLVHTLRSLSWYVGNRKLTRSWVPTYILLPFVGALLAFVFYVVIRGGFFSPEATINETSPFGFVAISALVGMFSTEASRKLEQVFGALFTERAQGEDHADEKNGEGSTDST